MLSLEVQQLTKTYNRRTVFSDLSFTHSKGILGISGANGSGKSTLLKCLGQLLRPKKGTILWNKDSKSLSKDEIKPLISYTAPYINLYSELTAFENLEFIQEVCGEEKDKPTLFEIFEFVQMNGYEDQLFKQLSTGQQQRIKLASALVRNSEILFLDEPGSNLDEKGHELVAKIVDQQKEKGVLVVLASNDPKEIELCDHVVNLVSG
ncbi:MAG: heme ABC exporter ATP-binding protein CcmA [Balneolaceae bacterium]